MKVNLEKCYHWRRRAWGPGPTEIPNDLAAALGLTGTPDKPQAAAAAIPDALKLINGVSVYREIQVIPTIGQGGAKRILDNRPDDGYPSLDAVWAANPELLEPPFKTDPETVAAWGAE